MAQKKSYLVIMKRLVAALSSIAKAKTLALKSKTNALKTRIVIFSLLNNKKLVMSSISHKFQGLIGHHHHLRDQESKSYGIDEMSTDLQSTKAFVIQSNDGITDVVQQETLPEDHQKHIVDCWKQEYDGDGDGDWEKYPNLTHSMFEMEEEEEEEGAMSSVAVSVIEMVKHSKEEKGEKFKLEDEIDHVADLFIKKFHRHILLQKQHSLKSYQNMLQRST